MAASELDADPLSFRAARRLAADRPGENPGAICGKFFAASSGIGLPETLGATPGREDGLALRSIEFRRRGEFVSQFLHG